MRRYALICLLLLMILLSAGSSHAQEQTLPIILSFTVDTPSLTLAEVEAGATPVTFSWKTLNMGEGYRLELYAYEIGTWALVSDPNQPLPANGDFELTVRHPLNFNPPSYRLLILDEQFQVYSESVVTIPYDTTGLTFEPSIVSFTVTQTSIAADDLAYGDPRLEVSWEVKDRNPTSNLVFEQVMADGSAVSVELSRRNLWVTSVGAGAIKPVVPASGNVVALRLSLIDLVSGEVLDEAGQQATMTGTVSTPTPRPANTQAPTRNPAEPTQAPQQSAQVAPPVANAGTGGGFELGGHIATFNRLDVVQSANMAWVKKQIRWRRGDDTSLAAAMISGAQGSGLKIMLGIVGYKDDMADFEGYTNDFAAYLAQVAAIGPNAIEVWNEPNIDREWPAGTISGANYTVMLSKAFNAIKGANASVMVISGAPAPTGFFGGTCAAGGCDDNVFLRQMANAGAVQYMDCIGAHYNEGIISPDQTSGDPRGGHYSRYFVGMLNLYYNTFNGARQVCWTELGFLTGEGYSPLPGGFAWAQNTTVAQHAEWLGLAARRSRESGRVRLMIVWNVDFATYDADPQAGYAIIRADGSCPACGALVGSFQ